MITLPYATVEDVNASLQVAYSARSARVVYDKLLAGTGVVEGRLLRTFYPEFKTVKFDWPNRGYSPSWTLDLGENELISLTSVTSGGSSIPTSAILLRRYDNKPEPPYDHLEIDLSTAYAFSSGDTFQQSLEIEGKFGFNDTDSTKVDGTLSGALSDSADTATILPYNSLRNIGIGSLLLIDSEYIFVSNSRMADSGQTLTTGISDLQNVEAIPVDDSSVFAISETILVDAERMLIYDIVGNTLYATRAIDGTPLASHSSGAAVYSKSSFTLTRGVVGSTAASHLDAASVTNHRYPGLVNELNIAETVVLLEQTTSAYARVIGSGAAARSGIGSGLEDLRMSAELTYGRRLRSGAV